MWYIVVMQKALIELFGAVLAFGLCSISIWLALIVFIIFSFWVYRD
jgi:hypothetical protein